MLMNLRKTANHPLLVIEIYRIDKELDNSFHIIAQVRDHYDDHKLGVIAR